MTNRTKIDWAYNQAKKLRARVLENGTMCPYDDIRAIATALRRAYKKGKLTGQ